MKCFRNAIAIILVFAVLTSLPVLAASDDLFCSFDASDLTLEIGSLYNIGGIVYSPTLHITEVSVDIFSPSSVYMGGFSQSVAGDGDAEFDLTDGMEIFLGEPGVYLIRWTASTREGIGFSYPVEKHITVVDRGSGGGASDDGFEDRKPLGEGSGGAQGVVGNDTVQDSCYEAPDLLPQPIEAQEERHAPAERTGGGDSADTQLIREENNHSADDSKGSSLALRTSEKGIAFIKAWESCTLYVYDDATNQRWNANSQGNPTIGYGHKLVSGDGFTTSSTITQEEAEALFLLDLSRREATCDEFLRRTGAVVTQNQYDALSSFFYNGNSYALDSGSFMYRLFNDYADRISEIPAWKIYNQFANYYSRTNASVRKGLLMRRLDEARVFVDAIYERFTWSIPDWATRGDVVPDEWYPEELGAPTPGNTRTEGDAPTAAVAPVSVFTDLPASDPCYNAVHRLALRGIITGTGGSKFSPNKTLTRAEACALICKLLGQGAKSPRRTSFSDVPSSHWGSGYIAWCTENGLLSGYGGGMFGPDDPLTVNQLGKILVSVLGEDEAALRKGGWPDGWSSMARELGLLEGVDCDGSSQIPRKYAAVMLDNAINEQAQRLLQSPLLSGSLVGHSSSSDGVVYVQTDSTWSKDTYGYCDGKPATYYNSACGVFSVVNAIHCITDHAFTDDEIRELAAFSVRKKYRVDDQGTSLALCKGASAEYGRQLGFRTDETVLYYGNNREVIRNIDCCLDCGGAVVFSVRTSKDGGHLMTIVDRRLTSNGTEYLLLDSYASSNRLGSGVNSGWVTMDAELDLHSASGKKIVTKGGEGYGFWLMFPAA